MTCERINLCRVLEESLLSFEGALQKANIEPTITISGREIWRMLDRSSVSRIFENVISNAIKYSDGDFIVCLSDDGVVSFTNAAKNLSSLEVSKLFDRFYTVDSARKSTGLGLSIAKLLTEQMNGTMSAHYENGNLTVAINFKCE